MKDNLQKKIDEFVDRVHPVYVFLGWTWVGVGIPTKEQIKDKLLHLIGEIKRSDTTSIRTAGLYVREMNDEGFIDYEFGFEMTGGSFYKSDL